MAYQSPSAEQALLFAKLKEAGVPALEAIGYVAPELAIEVRPDCARRWEKDGAVRAAQVRLKGDWLALSTEQRASIALEKHYNEMAYFLASHNYGELETAKQAKADKCRDALEKKLAGMAGKGDGAASFWADVLSGKVKFPSPQPVAVAEPKAVQ